MDNILEELRIESEKATLENKAFIMGPHTFSFLIKKIDKLQEELDYYESTPCYCCREGGYQDGCRCNIIKESTK